MATLEWFPRPKDYKREKNKRCLELACDHPLKETKETNDLTWESAELSEEMCEVSSNHLSSIESLNVGFDGNDPLSVFAAEAEAMSPKSEGSDQCDVSFEPWSSKKICILYKFTTSKKLSIAAPPNKKATVRTKHPATRVQTNLQQLEGCEKNVNKINELCAVLVSSWNRGRRIQALENAIQCSQLLTSVTVIYPSKFVLVTDVLDIFGKLVYDHIREKSANTSVDPPVPLAENFTPEEVPEKAKIACHNWFCRISSIKELIPRFYMEAAILKCYKYLDSNEHLKSLEKLSQMIRGVGDPLVALYARCYLCRVGADIALGFRGHLMPCFEDFVISLNQIKCDAVQNMLARLNLETPSYLVVYQPALEWIMQCLAYQANDNNLTEILHVTNKHCNSALILNSILLAFQPELIAKQASDFVKMIKNCDEFIFSKHELYCGLGSSLSLADPPKEQRLFILNEVWRTIRRLKKTDFMTCAEIWIDFVAKHFWQREIDIVIDDIIKHLYFNQEEDKYCPKLLSIICKILAHMHNFPTLFAMEKFWQLFHMIQQKNIMLETCRLIMEAFNNYQEISTNDPVIINSMLFLSKTIHDSLSVSPFPDSERRASELIIGFLRKISFSQDFDQQLGFYVDARASFGNLDSVLVFLVHSVNTLAVAAHEIGKRKGDQEIAGFVRACTAYCFITIPSLTLGFTQLNLFLLSGQVALSNQCLNQADDLFLTIIQLIPQIPQNMKLNEHMRQTEPLVVEFLSNFISTLLTVPDNPDDGFIMLLKKLLDVLKSCKNFSSDGKMIIYIQILSMLSAASQENYLYHIDKIDSNDTLYGSDPHFIEEIIQLTNKLVTKFLTYLRKLASQKEFKRQSYLIVKLFNAILAHSSLEKPSTCAFVFDLWTLFQKRGYVDTEQADQKMHYVRCKTSEQDYGNEFNNLLKKMLQESRA